jgi:polysaccharide biosynthesis transport protein
MSSFHPLDYLSLVRRRRWWLATPLVVCVLAGVALAVLLPRVYRAQATIAVTAPRLSTDIVGQGSVALSREERIRAISQQLVSRPVIEQVVVAENLAQDRPVSAVVDELLAPQRIKVELTPLLRQAAAERAPIDAFHVSYSDQVPERAQRITNRLATVFVEVNSRSREERAEDTAAFISNQLGDSKRRLDALEERLRQAKEAYMGRLPEQTSANLSMLSGLRQQLESTANSLRGE